MATTGKPARRPFKTRRVWATVSRVTGHVRIGRTRGDLTSGSRHLDGPYRVEIREVRRTRTVDITWGVPGCPSSPRAGYLQAALERTASRVKAVLERHAAEHLRRAPTTGARGISPQQAIDAIDAGAGFGASRGGPFEVYYPDGGHAVVRPSLPGIATHFGEARRTRCGRVGVRLLTTDWSRVNCRACLRAKRKGPTR